MAIRNETLVHECFPKHMRMGTARMKYDKETDKEGKREERVWEEVKRAKLKEVLFAYHILIKIQQ